MVSISEEYFEEIFSQKYPLEFNFPFLDLAWKVLFTTYSFLQVTVKCNFDLNSVSLINSQKKLFEMLKASQEQAKTIKYLQNLSLYF